jgi:hypothetical protein
MPLAKLDIIERGYSQDRIIRVSGTIQATLMNTFRAPHS